MAILQVKATGVEGWGSATPDNFETLSREQADALRAERKSSALQLTSLGVRHEEAQVRLAGRKRKMQECEAMDAAYRIVQAWQDTAWTWE